MQELLQAVLEDPTVRSQEAATVIASNAAAAFAPWGSGVVE